MSKKNKGLTERERENKSVNSGHYVCLAVGLQRNPVSARTLLGPIIFVCSSNEHYNETLCEMGTVKTTKEWRHYKLQKNHKTKNTPMLFVMTWSSIWKNKGNYSLFSKYSNELVQQDRNKIFIPDIYQDIYLSCQTTKT